MKHCFLYLTILSSQLFCHFAFGQNNRLVLEQVQMYSVINPEAKYWHPTNSQIQLFANNLDATLFKSLDLIRDTNYVTGIKILNKPNQLGKLVIDWSKSKLIPYHAYLEIYELPPQQTFENKMVPFEIPKKDSIQSTWFLTCTILDENKKTRFQKTILIGMIPMMNQGIGYPVGSPISTPNNLFRAIHSAISYFNKNKADIEYVEAKLPTCFATDNYIMPLIQAKPRINIDTSKGFIQYTQNRERKLLRVPGAVMNKIDTKDKSNNNPFFAILPEIRKRSSTLFKEYYQVLQPLRNVGENKDYTLETYIEFNPMIDPELRATPPIRFLPDSIHKIFEDTTLIGRFKVIENPINNLWMFNSNEIYNGFDSASIFKLNTNYPKRVIVHSKSIEGKIGKDDFTILFNDDIDVKMIYLNKVAIMAVQGKNRPNNLVPLQEINQNTISSLLLMFAYSEIFQSPN